MLRNITKIVQSQKAKFATASAAKPNPNPEILYTGVSLFIIFSYIISINISAKRKIM